MTSAKTLTSGPTSVMIDHEPFMMTASLNVDGGITTLSLYLSDIVDWDSSMLDAVRQVIDNQCVRLSEKTLRDDQSMYGGQAWEYQYLVFDECPVDVNHLCNRKGVECPTTKIRVCPAAR